MLPEGRDPSPFLRLFWCVMLALVPLTMIANQISLKTVKTSVILTSIPFLFLLVAMAWGLVKWLHADYRHRSAADIEAESRRLGEEGNETAQEGMSGSLSLVEPV